MDPIFENLFITVVPVENPTDLAGDFNKIGVVLLGNNVVATDPLNIPRLGDVDTREDIPPIGFTFCVVVFPDVIPLEVAVLVDRTVRRKCTGI